MGICKTRDSPYFRKNQHLYIMPSSAIYLDINVQEHHFLKIRTSWSMSGKFTSIDNKSYPTLLNRSERKKVNNLLKGYRYRNQAVVKPDTVNGLGTILRSLIGREHHIEPSQSFLLRAPSQYLQYITNIPWELAALKAVQPGRSPDFSDLLANIPFGRVIQGYMPNVPIKNYDKLRVHYCISDSQGTLNATAFKNDLDKALRQRSAFVERSTTISDPENPFAPTFIQLLNDIELKKPDIIILVCHGSTKSGEPRVNFSGNPYICSPYNDLPYH